MCNYNGYSYKILVNFKGLENITDADAFDSFRNKPIFIYVCHIWGVSIYIDT